MKLPQKLLIANRGEIAARILRTCRRLGIETLVVYAGSDRLAPYLARADESLELSGKNPYLDQEQLLAVACERKVDAIHPGYGFLSENAGFARAVTEAGIRFIGPGADTIELLGDKQQARELAVRLGIPVLQGRQISPQSEADDISLAFPIMLKATGAGGGRAMRRVYREEDLAQALEEVEREAVHFSDSSTIIAERLLQGARHIEVQVCGFQQAPPLYLGERDCSLQRRFQKLIEEAPAIALETSVREGITEAALRMAAEASLTSLATVEFLVLGAEYFFLEVNPRLQVEHPVTESITGLDLVELQIRAATDEEFSLEQEEVAFRGHSIEVRIVSEAPERSYLPSSARIEHLSFPPGELRIEQALRVGMKPNLAFDSLLAKLIVHGNDAAVARKQMQQALASFDLLGPAHNAAFLHRVLDANAPFTIDFLEHSNAAVLSSEIERSLKEFACAAAVSSWLFSYQSGSPFGFPSFRHGRDAQVLELQVSSESFEEAAVVECVLHAHSDGSPLLRIGELGFRARLLQRENGSLRLEISAGGVTATARVLTTSLEPRTRLGLLGYSFEVAQVRPERRVSAHDYGTSAVVRADLPGIVTAVLVTSGSHVDPGTPLVSLESMKIEHVLRAESAATIGEILVTPGQSVDKHTALLNLLPEEQQ